MAINKDNFCVIMGGGIGSRFWPFSRKTLPKQFLDFFGTGRSLLQQTFDRFKKSYLPRTSSLSPTPSTPTLCSSSCPN